MFSKTKRTLIAAVAVATLSLTACGGNGEASGPSNDGQPVGDPVSGGTMRIIEAAQPTGFDPVQVFSSTSMPVTFTGLYGQFIISNPETGGYDCGLCESFTTTDEGASWIVKTKEGMTFTDGTPFDAEALKYNWDRMKDPQFGSASAGMASQIKNIEIVDERTAKLNMVVPTPGFMGLMPIYSLQWIASPTALAKGQEEFNKNPIGAGPFVYDSWTPGGTVSLKRNEDYQGGDLAYLDKLEIQGVTDNTQRSNALLSGQADMIMGNEPVAFQEGEASGKAIESYTFNGGTGFMMNTAKAPFDDVRARQALRYALNLDALNASVSRGAGTVPKTLFTEDSPLYSDVPMNEHNPQKAQELFDELAAEGKPVDFKYTVFPGPGAAQFDALQAQLAEYQNVKVTADQRDSSQTGVVTTSGDFDVAYSSLAFVDPASRMWGALHGTAERTNYARLNDEELNNLLDVGLSKVDAPIEQQNEAYKAIQERLAVVTPYILMETWTVGTISNDNVHGVEMFGYTTPNAGSLWISQ